LSSVTRVDTSFVGASNTVDFDDIAGTDQAGRKQVGIPANRQAVAGRCVAADDELEQHLAGLRQIGMPGDHRGGGAIETAVGGGLLDVEELDRDGVVVVDRVGRGVGVRVLREPLDGDAEGALQLDGFHLGGGDERIDAAGRLADAAVVVGRREERNRGRDQRREDDDHDEELDQGEAAGESRVEGRGSRARMRAQPEPTVPALDSRLLTLDSHAIR
jgi:hypothetical protein